MNHFHSWTIPRLTPSSAKDRLILKLWKLVMRSHYTPVGLENDIKMNGETHKEYFRDVGKWPHRNNEPRPVKPELESVKDYQRGVRELGK